MDVNRLSWNGIATHYIHSSSLPDLEQRLSELVFKDYASFNERCQIINSTIEEFTTGLPHDQPMTLAGDMRKAIDGCFRADNIETILSALEQEGSSWATKTIKTIRERGPTSVKVTLKQMQLGKSWSIDEAFQREYHIASKFMEHPDFVEGVTAKLIKKPPQPPRWQPAYLDEVADAEVQSFFTIPRGTGRLRLLKSGAGTDYKAYPHAWIGLPTEEAVRSFVTQTQKSSAETVAHFLQITNGKLGVREKLEEMLSRKTIEESGVARWLD